MLKISRLENASVTVTLRLEGSLIGPWVGVLQKTCEPLLSKGRRVVLELADVAFVDQSGVSLLRRLTTTGVTLSGGSPFVMEQLRADERTHP